jgi:hypothetical protein
MAVDDDVGKEWSEQLRSKDPKVFIEAYEKLIKSGEIANRDFPKTSISGCYNRSLEMYRQRYEDLSSSQ